MQRGREVRNNFLNQVAPLMILVFLGDFPSILGGRDPFDDPFFTRPFGTSFEPSMSITRTPGNVQHRIRLSGPVIEELDDEGDESVSEENGYDHDTTHAACVNRNPIEHPEDQVIDHDKSNGKHVACKISGDKLETQPHTQSASFERVTYGGINGEYSTAMTTRRIGNDGVTLEESKEADRTTGLATHIISRGIVNKGHSITRTLDPDGKMSLLSLNKDEKTTLTGICMVVMMDLISLGVQGLVLTSMVEWRLLEDFVIHSKSIMRATVNKVLVTTSKPTLLGRGPKKLSPLILNKITSQVNVRLAVSL